MYPQVPCPLFFASSFRDEEDDATLTEGIIPVSAGAETTVDVEDGSVDDDAAGGRTLFGFVGDAVDSC